MIMPNTGLPKATQRQVTLQRIYDAPIEAVWAMWTTRSGIESWWGPEGFEVTVDQIDVRPGGVLHYSMAATGADQLAFMTNAGMPVVSQHQLTYTDVVATTRLAYSHLVDFVPDVESYDVATLVELAELGHRTRLSVHIDAMHDDEWTQRATMGWDSELDKLTTVLAATLR